MPEDAEYLRGCLKCGVLSVRVEYGDESALMSVEFTPRGSSQVYEAYYSSLPSQLNFERAYRDVCAWLFLRHTFGEHYGW